MREEKSAGPRLKVRIKLLLQRRILPVLYSFFKKKEIVPGLVIFADGHHFLRPSNMDLLYKELSSAEGITLKECYLDLQRAGFLQTIRFLAGFMKLYANANALVICDNFLPAAGCKKRDETYVVQLWHACGALKRFGYDSAEDMPPGYSENIYKNTDLVCVSAPACVPFFESAMNLREGQVQPVGVSRTDSYFDPEWNEEKRAAFFRLHPEAEGKKVVVYAPTFRGNASDPHVSYPDMEALSSSLGEECYIVKSLHPHMSKLEGELSQVQELFPAADVLITDYSSLIYEYLLYKKPLVLYMPDYEEYKALRGFYNDPLQVPAFLCRREEDLAQTIKKALAEGIDRENTKSFLDTFMSGCDSKATKRIADMIKERIKS